MHTITLKSTRPAVSGRKANPEAVQQSYDDLAAIIAEGGEKWAALNADAKSYKQRYDAVYAAYRAACDAAGVSANPPPSDNGADDYAELGYW